MSKNEVINERVLGWQLLSYINKLLYGPLVEMVNTPACHAGDQGFETPTDRHYPK